MTDIPEEIWHIAEFIVADRSSPEEKAELIARAILAERERCALIIKPLTAQSGVGGVHIRKAAWIALDAIRTPSTAIPTPELTVSDKP